jgi:hypothetical protein
MLTAPLTWVTVPTVLCALAVETATEMARIADTTNEAILE